MVLGSHADPSRGPAMGCAQLKMVATALPQPFAGGRWVCLTRDAPTITTHVPSLRHVEEGPKRRAG